MRKIVVFVDGGEVQAIFVDKEIADIEVEVCEPGCTYEEQSESADYFDKCVETMKEVKF